MEPALLNLRRHIIQLLENDDQNTNNPTDCLLAIVGQKHYKSERFLMLENQRLSDNRNDYPRVTYLAKLMAMRYDKGVAAFRFNIFDYSETKVERIRSRIHNLLTTPKVRPGTGNRFIQPESVIIGSCELMDSDPAYNKEKELWLSQNDYKIYFAQRSP